jgi:hypothetical protein
MGFAGNVACVEEVKNVYRILVRKPKGMRPQEIMCDNVDYFHLLMTRIIVELL